ncbi:MAG: hypothetical protein JWL63_1869 [Rhodocyclales bacterium]|nr:hypothetical protein [Rhodocyclales bacterium]
MTCSCLIAGLVENAMHPVRRKFAARVGAEFMDAAFHFHADFAYQRNATWRAAIGATHAARARGLFIGECRRNVTTCFRVQLTAMETDTKSGAAGAT